MAAKITDFSPSDTKTWFSLVILYLVVDYGRPQDLLPIGFMRPGLIMILLLTVYLVKSKALFATQAAQVKLIWGFIALLAIHIPFAHNNFWAYQTWLDMMKYMPFIVSVVVCINSIVRLKVFMRWYISIMIYISSYALLHNGVGSGNYFGDENDVSLYINVVLPFCYFLFLAEKGTKFRWVYASALIIGLFAVIVSFSRGGFVGLVVMFFIIWLVSPRKLLSLFLISALVAIAYFYSGDTYRQEMATVTDTSESTANARLMSWASGWDMFLDNPLGVGGNNFQHLFSDYQEDRFKREMGGRVAHSLWFTLIPEVGIVGILLYLRLLYLNFVDVRKLMTKGDLDDPNLGFLNSMSIAFIASLAGFFASASFISVLYYPHYWYLTAIIVATANVSVRYRKSLNS